MPNAVKLISATALVILIASLYSVIVANASYNNEADRILTFVTELDESIDSMTHENGFSSVMSLTQLCKVPCSITQAVLDKNFLPKHIVAEKNRFPSQSLIHTVGQKIYFSSVEIIEIYPSNKGTTSSVIFLTKDQKLVNQLKESVGQISGVAMFSERTAAKNILVILKKS